MKNYFSRLFLSALCSAAVAVGSCSAMFAGASASSMEARCVLRTEKLAKCIAAISNDSHMMCMEHDDSSSVECLSVVVSKVAMFLDRCLDNEHPLRVALYAAAQEIRAEIDSKLFTDACDRPDIRDILLKEEGELGASATLYSLWEHYIKNKGVLNDATRSELRAKIHEMFFVTHSIIGDSFIGPSLSVTLSMLLTAIEAEGNVFFRDLYLGQLEESVKEVDPFYLK